MTIYKDQPKVGEKIMMSIKGFGRVEAEVKEVSDLIENESGKGWDVWVSIGGRSYQYWFINSVKYDRSLSGMPYDKMGKDFNWRAYGEDTELQRKICNAFISQYIEYRKEGRGLYIFSETMGTGKTFLACCIANEVMSKYNTIVKFITSAEYLELCRIHDEKQKEYQTAALLIFDDLGAQADKTEFQKESIFRLIDGRYRENLSTIYTSNLPFNYSSNDDRVFSRVYGSSTPVQLPEVSIRKKNADKYRTEFLRRIMTLNQSDVRRLEGGM